MPLKVYYDIVEYRKSINTFHPPKNVYTNMGDAINSKAPDYGPALGGADSVLVFSSKRKRRGLTGGGPSATTRIEVLARQGLGRTSSVQLVRVAGRTLVLGVTEHSVQVLGEADPLLLAAEQALVPEVTEASQAPGWGPLLEALKDRTVRR